MEGSVQVTKRELGEAVAGAAVAAADLVTRKRGVRVAVLAAAASFLASVAVGIPVTVVLVHEADGNAHEGTLANCQAIERVRPQANARVLFQQVLFEIALDRAPHYPTRLQSEEVRNINRILALAPKVAPGVAMPSQIRTLADLSTATQFYPLIDCRKEVGS